ncbi:hypothetical protein GCM10012275_12590 [Longimycelium tulufanense]|uniref:YCII-related domain-containing protein n=1 Tax=Longimycelium tulufanense TaxID=907463 RepID=A0A8J3FSV7_9PSEU|nr:hypothetical protein [Longimycelium tulufanense]GGM43102.1 hypothetical protein GCM10012275_12590 [Longimycelium tulufanense]
MYIALLKLTATVEEVDLVLPDHAEWLAAEHERGRFLASGRVHRDAARVILIAGMPRGRVDALLATDPLVVKRLARYEVIQFDATRTAPGMLALNEAVAS